MSTGDNGRDVSFFQVQSVFVDISKHASSFFSLWIQLRVIPIRRELMSQEKNYLRSITYTAILIQALGTKPQTAYVDLGYRNVDKDNLGLDIKYRGKFNSLTDDEKKSLKRRQAIVPIIGHLELDHRMNRCHLKG